MREAVEAIGRKPDLLERGRGDAQRAEAGDADAMESLLAENVVFRSPAVHAPYEGQTATMVLLRSVVETGQTVALDAAVKAQARPDALLVATETCLAVATVGAPPTARQKIMSTGPKARPDPIAERVKSTEAMTRIRMRPIRSAIRPAR